MKILLLMRHGKASWKDVKKDEDKLRPLTKKGEKEAKAMSEHLKEKDILPQVILTSTARRARETANVFLAQCCGEVTFTALDSLYMAEPPAVIDALKMIPDGVERVMVIGHNPGLETLLQLVTGRVESLSTASVVYLELPIDSWSAISLDVNVEKCEKWKPKDE
jgi:phosphohistidine phosphatase